VSDRLTAPAESWRPQRQRGAVDPQIKRMGLIAGGVAAMLALGFGAYSLIGMRPHGVPLIEADSRPIRVRPPNPGGMQVAGAEEQIMGAASNGQADAMAPLPETPEPQTLQAQIRASHQPDPPVPVQPALSASSAAAPAAPVSPPPEVHAAPVPAMAAPPRVHAPPPAVGKTEVQLAAMVTEQAAMAEWDRLAKRMPALLSAHHPVIMKASRDGRTFFRLRTGGFADSAQATAFCTAVRTRGAECSVASF
jgi:hypothetical protein